MLVRTKENRSQKHRICDMGGERIEPGRVYVSAALIGHQFTLLNLCCRCAHKIGLVLRDGISSALDAEELFALAEEAHRKNEQDLRDDYLYERWKERHYEMKHQ